ncbi:MAG: hypothetical protein H6736_18900 [Alphaproteobacteria bacterium]|nr:hypothetical protein [Alphaproteobacteria bacterium]
MKVRRVDLGPEVVKLLVAQRPPMLWLDRIVGLALDGETPEIHGQRFLSANEPVFAGHFPGLGLMPGMLAMEGLAQCAEALATLLLLRGAGSTDDLLDDLRNLELGATFDPRYDRERDLAFRGRIQAREAERVPSVAGSAKAKFARPVFPGSRLDYVVRLGRRMDHLAHFDLEASVGRELVVHGSFSTARLDGRTWPA